LPSLYDLKPRFQSLLRPAADALGRTGVTPNQITLAALGLSAVAGAAVVAAPTSGWPLLALPVVLFVRMALNALDGMVARASGLESRFGAALNEAADVVSDCALYLPLALVPGVPAGLVVVAVATAVTAEAAGLAGLRSGAGRVFDGPMGKSDRALAFGALAIALGAGVPAGRWVGVVLGAIAALGALTVVNRARRSVAAS
jgi:CDP-diacylglycerol--glycerol-3-phosphate 3-phosphatidyltransferase